MIQLKYTSILLFLLLVMERAISQQDNHVIAKGGPNGIFIFLGDHPLNANMSFKIERRNTQEQDFKEIAVIHTASDLNSFKKNYRQARELSSFFEDINEKKLDLLWNKIQRYPDSVKFLITSLPLQLAAGLMYFDNTAAQNTQYVFRVSASDPGSSKSLQKVSSPVSFPGKVIYPKLFYSAYSFSPHQLKISWKSKGLVNAAYFMLTRADKEKKGFTPVRAFVIHKLIGDSTFITTIDTDITSGKTYEYKLMAADEFGNIGLTTSSHLMVAYNPQQVVLPQNLFSISIDSLSDHGIKISWTLKDTQYIRSIKIYRSETEHGRYTFYSELPAGVNVFVDRLVEPAKFYFYHLTTLGIMGEESNPTINFPGIYYSTSVASAPVILNYKAVKGGVTIGFSSNDREVSGYRVFRCTGLNGIMQQISPSITSSDQTIYFTDSSRILNGKETYGYAVIAENSSHMQSAFSDTVYVRPLINRVPSTPRNVTVVNTKDGNKIFWQNMRVTDQTISGYNVFKSAGPISTGRQNFEKINRKIIGASSNSFLDSSADHKLNYFYYVQSMDGFGNLSISSEIVSTQIISNTTQIAAPQGLAGYSSTDGIHLEWLSGNSINITSFKIYRYQRGENPQLIATIKKESIMEYVDKTGVRGNLYFYYLIAVDKSGTTSDRGNELSISVDN